MKPDSHALHGIALRHASDESLVSECAHNPEVFAEVYRRYHSRIYGYCLARLLSRELAEDAAQETFVRLLAADTSRVTSPRSWLYAIARNVCTDIWRQRGRESVRDDISDAEIADTSPDAAEAVSIAHDTRNGMLALRRMRPRYRAALILREMHGLPVREIAQSLGISEGAAHTLVTRARDSFARTYAETSGRPEPCMDAMMLLFSRDNRTLAENEQVLLDRHLETCPWCRAQSRTTTSARLSAMLPFALVGEGRFDDLLTRIGLAVKPIPEPLRDLCVTGNTAAHVSSQFIVPLLITASLALPAMVNPPSTDVIARGPDSIANEVTFGSATHDVFAGDATGSRTADQNRSAGTPEGTLFSGARTSGSNGIGDGSEPTRAHSSGDAATGSGGPGSGESSGPRTSGGTGDASYGSKTAGASGEPSESQLRTGDATASGQDSAADPPKPQAGTSEPQSEGSSGERSGDTTEPGAEKNGMQ